MTEFYHYDIEMKEIYIIELIVIRYKPNFKKNNNKIKFYR